MSTFTFAVPKRKKRVFCRKESPLPVPIATVAGRPASAHNWEHYTGHLVDGHVIIKDADDAQALYKMGFFGKGTLSRSEPEYGQIPSSLKRRYKRTESNVTERRLQQVSRRKYLCHLKWCHQGAVQKGETPPDCYSESDDVEIQDDQTARVHQTCPMTHAQESIINTSSPSKHQRLECESSFSAENATECSREADAVSREDDAVGGRSTEDPWAAGDRKESLQFWGVPDKPGETLDWGAGGEEEAREFWGMGGNDKGDTCRVKASDTVLPVAAQSDVILGTPQNDDVKLKTVQNYDATQRSSQSSGVTLGTDQSSGVTLKTTENDDAMLRTSQSDDVRLGTAQNDGVTLGTAHIDGIILNTAPTDVKCETPNVSPLKVPSIDISDCDVSTGVSLTPSEDVVNVQRPNDVDPRSMDAERDGDWFVVPDSWDSDQGIVTSTAQLPWQPVVKRDPFELRECLQLSLVEAFFLSYGLGCLTVIDGAKGALHLTEMWNAFSRCQRNFVRDYVAYHNFRSKGWVPKSGLKYGTEFILYKDGPPFYHASYSVMVRLVNDDLDDDPSDENRTMTWTSLAGLNRMTEQVGKEVMLCYVIKPRNISPADLQSPNCLSRFRIQEVILRRWVSTQEREPTEGCDIP